MPQVRALLPSVQSRQTGNVAIRANRIDAPRAAFGGLEAQAQIERGQAVQGLGDLISEHSLRMQAEQEEADAIEAYNQLSSEIIDYTDNPEYGKLQTQRKNARGITETGARDFDDMVRRNGKELKGRAATRYSRMALSDKRGVLSALSRHEAREAKAYRVEMVEAGIENLKDQSISRPAEFNENLDKAKQLALTSMEGSSADVKLAKLHDVSNEFYLSVINRHLVSDNIEAAGKLLADGKTSGGLSGDALSKAEEAYNQRSVGAKIYENVDRILAAGGGFGKQQKAADKIKDPLVRKGVSTELARRYHLRNALQANGERNAGISGISHIDAGGTPTDIPPAVWAGMTPKARAAVWNRYARAAEGRGPGWRQNPGFAAAHDAADRVRRVSAGETGAYNEAKQILDDPDEWLSGEGKDLPGYMVNDILQSYADALLAVDANDDKAAAAASKAEAKLTDKLPAGVTSEFKQQFETLYRKRPSGNRNLASAQKWDQTYGVHFQVFKRLYLNEAQRTKSEYLPPDAQSRILNDAFKVEYDATLPRSGLAQRWERLAGDKDKLKLTYEVPVKDLEDIPAEHRAAMSAHWLQVMQAWQAKKAQSLIDNDVNRAQAVAFASQEAPTLDEMYEMLNDMIKAGMIELED